MNLYELRVADVASPSADKVIVAKRSNGRSGKEWGKYDYRLATNEGI
jgi:hypothetical protein